MCRAQATEVYIHINPAAKQSDADGLSATTLLHELQQSLPAIVHACWLVSLAVSLPSGRS